MAIDTANTDSEDIIDNALESFPFFPIRLTCLLISTGGMGLAYLSITDIHDIWLAITGLFIMLVFFPLVIIQKRITVNLTQNTYHEYHTYFGIKNGKWKSFKGFTIITITRSTEMHRLGSRYGVNSIDVASTDFCLNLKQDNYNKLNIAAGGYHSMLKKAIALALRHKVGIMDCREKPIKKYTYEEVVQEFS